MGAAWSAMVYSTDDGESPICVDREAEGIGRLLLFGPQVAAALVKIERSFRTALSGAVSTVASRCSVYVAQHLPW